MNDLNIITCGDSNYFKFLWRFEQNIFKQFGKYPIIYDLGLSNFQKEVLKSDIRQVPFNKNFNKYNKLGFIQTVHKPNCILDLLNEFNDDVLYLDADMIVSQRAIPAHFNKISGDIAVTPRHKEERYEKLLINGYINAGFIFFKNNSNTKEFIKLWIGECQKSEATDQIALSNLVFSQNIEKSTDIFHLKEVKYGNLSIEMLNANFYNDIALKSGFIRHYKNAGRSSIVFIRYAIDFFLIQKSIPLLGFNSFSFKLISRIKNLIYQN